MPQPQPQMTRLPHGPAPVATERRTHRRLRDLCDEVLASYRLAVGDDLFCDADRAAARALTTQITRA